MCQTPFQVLFLKKQGQRHQSCPSSAASLGVTRQGFRDPGDGRDVGGHEEQEDEDGAAVQGVG